MKKGMCVICAQAAELDLPGGDRRRCIDHEDMPCDLWEGRISGRSAPALRGVPALAPEPGPGLADDPNGTAVPEGPASAGPGRRPCDRRSPALSRLGGLETTPSAGFGRSPTLMSCRGTGRPHEGTRPPGTVARSFRVSVRKSAPGPIPVSLMVVRESADPVSAFSARPLGKVANSATPQGRIR